MYELTFSQIIFSKDFSKIKSKHI